MAVSTIAALIVALGGPPGEVQLAPGNYGSLILKCATPTDRNITVVPEDPAKPPVIAGLEVTGCGGLTFKGLDFTVSSRTLRTVTVKSSRNIFIVGGRQYSAGLAGTGVFFQFCASCGLSGAEVFGLGAGAVAASSDHITFAGNRFHDLTGDAMQTSATSFVTIDGNTGTDFYPPTGSHPDFYQNFTLGQTTQMTDFVITNNTYVRGKGLPTQGIFMGDEANVGVKNVTIRGNVILGAMYNGIATPFKADTVTITDNIVQAWVGMGSGIYANGTNVTVSGNRSTSYSPAAFATGNITLKVAAVGDVSILYPPSPPPPPPPPPPPVVVDPKDVEIARLTTERDAALSQLAASEANLAKVSADLATAVQAGSVLQADKDALTASNAALTAAVAARQALLDQIRVLAGQ